MLHCFNLYPSKMGKAPISYHIPMTRIIEFSFNTKPCAHHMASMAELSKAFWQYNLSLQVGRWCVSADVETLSELALQNRRCKLQKLALCPASAFQTQPKQTLAELRGHQPPYCLMWLAAESAHLFTRTNRFHFNKGFHSLRISGYFHSR